MNKKKKTTNKIRVHIADDHQILIDGIIAVLDTEETMQVSGYSLDGNEVLKWFESGNETDVLILDIGMPGADGIEVIRSLKLKNLLPPTVVLTSYDDVKLIKEVLKLGAMGFVSKMNASESIVEAIKSVHEGELYFSSDINKKIVSVFSGNDINEEQRNKYLKNLTNREVEILKLLAREMSNQEIANTLFISINTVETHKRNIMTKLGIKNATGLGIYIAKNRLFNT